MLWRRILVLVALGLAGCDGASTGQQTLVAHEDVMLTREYSLRATSTSSMEELLLTLDSAEVMATRMSARQLNLIATLDEMGVLLDLPPTDIPTPTIPATATPDMSITPDANPSPEVVLNVPTEPSATPTDVVVTPFAPTSPPTRAPATQSLYSNLLREAVTATGVGNDDCAISAQTVFTPQTQEIYIVARAYNITAGSTIRSDWSRDGILLTQFDFTPDFAINGECIWFFADQTDFDFTPGTYQVALFVNNQEATAPAMFTIGAN